MIETIPEATSRTLAEVLSELEFDHLRFLVKRLEVSTDKEAAELIGYEPKTISRWKAKGFPIDEALRALATDGIVVASEILRRKVAKAAAIKVAGLDAQEEDKRQCIASEVLDRVLGKPAQKQEITGRDGGPVAIEHDIDSDTIAEALRILGG